MDDEFSWDDPKSVVVEPVNAIAAYLDAKENLVIRQRAKAGDSDSVIVVPRDSMGNFLGALSGIAGAQVPKVVKPADDTSPVTWPPAPETKKPKRRKG